MFTARVLSSSVLALALSFAAPLYAQTGTYTAGDLYLYSPAITGISSTGGAIVHVDLSAGTASMFVDTVTTLSAQGAMAWDPFRCRLVFCAGLNTVSDPLHLWAADAAGGLLDLGSVGIPLASMAPRGDGLIYMRQTNSTSTPLRVLTAANTLLTLLDDATGLPYLIQGNGAYAVMGMIHDAGTNALFVATNPVGACPGGAAGRVNVVKLPLTADGLRVAGPESCAQFEVSTSGETPVGWSRGPAGSLVLVVDTNANANEPRMLLVDPVTLGISVFASNNNIFSAATNAGSWSSALSKVVILDTGNDVLRAFGAGESNSSGVIVPSAGIPVSAAGSSGEVASLVEIEAGPNAAWPQYGVGLAGTGGIVPVLRGEGCTSEGAAITIITEQIVGAAPGFLFIGTAPASVPFKGGSFLVGSLFLQIPMNVGGAPGAPGAGSLSFATTLSGTIGLSGLSLYMQTGWVDAGAVQGASLSNGLRMILN